MHSWKSLLHLTLFEDPEMMQQIKIKIEQTLIQSSQEIAIAHFGLGIWRHPEALILNLFV